MRGGMRLSRKSLSGGCVFIGTRIRGGGGEGVGFPRHEVAFVGMRDIVGGCVFCYIGSRSI